jgi:AcrR family transcriptional regulator
MAEKNRASSRRGPKGDKRDRTRATLLDAARAVVREKGYARTTLAAVARRAGMTTGAIYGNFKNRDELFIALGQTYWAPVTPRVEPGATFAEVMHAMAEATLDGGGGAVDGAGLRADQPGFARASSRDHRGQL